MIKQPLSGWRVRPIKRITIDLDKPAEALMAMQRTRSISSNVSTMMAVTAVMQLVLYNGQETPLIAMMNASLLIVAAFGLRMCSGMAFAWLGAALAWKNASDSWRSTCAMKIAENEELRDVLNETRQEKAALQRMVDQLAKPA